MGSRGTINISPPGSLRGKRYAALTGFAPFAQPICVNLRVSAVRPFCAFCAFLRLFLFWS